MAIGVWYKPRQCLSTGKLAIAEIEMKAQNLSERMAFVEEFMKQQHGQAHEAAMQASSSSSTTPAGLAQQQQDAQAMSQASAPDRYGAGSAARSGASNYGGASG